MDWKATRRLAGWEKALIAGFFLVLLPALGALVEYRSALLTRRMGDLDCFLRASWAVRTDNDLYAVTSNNNWHYNYPPLLAILLTPLADPPPGESPDGYLPYALSVAIFFLLNVLCLLASAHVLASALEERLDDASLRTQPRFCLRWWGLRLWPVLICFLPMGHTMVRGQANLILLAALCFMAASWIRGQSLRAGLWLALAICIKVIPVYLLVYPLWKRDWRSLGGCVIGLILGLGLVPLTAFGPERTVTHYETYARVMLGPAFHLNEDNSRGKELLDVKATFSISFKTAIHNWSYPDFHQRPNDMHPVGKAVYLLLGFLMTFVTLWPGTWPRRESPMLVASQVAGLIGLMALFSPVCHSHYLVHCMPMVMVTFAQRWQHQESTAVPAWLWTIFAVFFATVGLAYLPGLEVMKDRCTALFATIPLWGIPVAWMWRNGYAMLDRGYHVLHGDRLVAK
jgi:hypothetical protein